MLRHLIALSTVLSAVSFASAAPRPKGDDRDESYFPTTVGDKLVFAVTHRSVEGIVVRVLVRTRTVTAVKRTDGEIVVTIRDEMDMGPAPEPQTYRVSSQGVFQVGQGTVTFDPPHCVLPRPVKAGTSWQQAMKWPGDISATAKYSSSGEEEVEVPAGRFRAIRVEQQLELPVQVFQTTTWEAPGLGTVKSHTRGGGNDQGEVTQVLKSFTPGKR